MLVVSVLFVCIPTIIFPASHRALRNRQFYITLTVLSMVFPIISGYFDKDKITWAISLSPVSFLLLYKLFDHVIRVRDHRPISFYVQYSFTTSDKERGLAGWLDIVFQLILFALPMIWAGIGHLVFSR